MKSVLPMLLAIVLSSNALAEESIKIGVILPLSGDGAYWGENTRNGALLAQRDINDSGGIEGKKLQLVIEDGRCSAKESVNAMHKLIGVDKVSAVIGEVCDSAGLAMAPLADQYKVVMINPCSEAPNITAGHEFVFRTWPPNDRQARLVARYLRDQLKITKVAVLSIVEAYADPMAEAFTKQFKHDGGIVSSHQTFEVGNLDLRTQLIRVNKDNPEAIFLVAFPAEAVAAVKQMKQLGMTQKVIGVSAMDSKAGFFDPLGKLADGIILSTLNDTSTPAFRARYQREFNFEWQGVGTCAAVGYDSVALLGAAFRAVGTAAPKVREYLADLKDFPGMSGPITFNASRDLDRQHALFEIKAGTLQPVRH